MKMVTLVMTKNSFKGSTVMVHFLTECSFSKAQQRFKGPVFDTSLAFNLSCFVINKRLPETPQTQVYISPRLLLAAYGRRDLKPFF